MPTTVAVAGLGGFFRPDGVPTPRNFKRLLVRYERRGEMHRALLLALACCFVCWRRLRGSR